MLHVKDDYFLKPKMPPLVFVENAGLPFGDEDFLRGRFISSSAGSGGCVPRSRWSMDLPVLAAS